MDTGFLFAKLKLRFRLREKNIARIPDGRSNSNFIDHILFLRSTTDASSTSSYALSNVGSRRQLAMQSQQRGRKNNTAVWFPRRGYVYFVLLIELEVLFLTILYANLFRVRRDGTRSFRIKNGRDIFRPCDQVGNPLNFIYRV